MPPPQKITLSKQVKKSLIACAVLFAISFNCHAIIGDTIDKDYLLNDEDTGEGEYDQFRLTLTKNEDFSGIHLPDFNPPSQHDQYAILVKGAKVNIKGATFIDSLTNEAGEKPEGTITISAQKGGVISLDGNVEIYIKQLGVTSTYGANGLYAKDDNSKIIVGNADSSSTIWTLAEQPDLISAKGGGQVIFNSTRNKLVGSIDMMDQETLGTANSIVDLKISEDGNYWFGDEMSLHNSSIAFSSNLPEEAFRPILMLLGLKSDYFLGTEEINDLLSNKKITDLIKSQGIILEGEGEKINLNQEFKLTLSDGAQWTYFGFTKGESKEMEIEFIGIKFNVSVYSVPKRISSITLSNGGIINLFDEDIRNKWEEIGLSKLWPELKDIDHDYIRIGDLKGNGGIFRLDLDAEDRQNSDMVFIESSSDGGQHFIEPYNMELLESVSPTNTLTFALQERPKNGKFVSFAEKQNIYGQSLFDYELEIDSRGIDSAEQISDIKYDSWSEDEDEDKDDWAADYVGGKEWFIKRVKMIESAASIGMRSAGYASYDLAVNMDRRDRRLQNTVFQNEEKDGLWARVQYGEAGAEHLYNADLTTVYVGYEKTTSADNRLGFSFAYTDGDSDFNDLKGTGELKRYEASVYDTLTFGSHYLDFVARFGQVDNEFDVTNQSGALTTTGSFDQKYAALSAEYGYNFKDEHNVFIEPQVQLQVAYLGDYNYRTERNMKVDADSDISVIGRVGLRAGKAFESSNYVGELYARADVLHQFTDGQDAQFSDLSNKVGVTWGDKDTWSTFGVGGYLNWKDNMSFQVDVERTAGGETIDTWLVSGRVNYLF